MFIYISMILDKCGVHTSGANTFRDPYYFHKMYINIPNIALNSFYSQYTIFRISCHALTASAELIVKVSKVNVCVCVPAGEDRPQRLQTGI